MTLNKVKLEALLNAIGRYYGAFDDPDQPAYKLRNPLLIRSFSVPGRHDVDKEGRRIFKSFLAGYRACLYDLEIKLSGHSRAKIRNTDAIENLLRVYGITEPASQEVVVKFLRRALNDTEIKRTTSLSYFSE